MPTYEYVCAKCGQEFEKFQPISAKPLATCLADLCGQKKWGRGKVKRKIGGGAGLDHLFRRDPRGVIARIDRHAQTRPQMTDSAHVVFVRVGDEDADQLVGLFGDEGGVGHHQVDPGAGFHVSERDAAIDHDPAPLGALAMTVQVHVHPDFARATGNLIGINVLPAMGANVYDILNHDTLVLTKAAVEKLEARFNG